MVENFIDHIKTIHIFLDVVLGLSQSHKSDKCFFNIGSSFFNLS